MLGCHLKIQAHYPYTFYWLVVGSTYVKWVTQTSMGYAEINLSNPYIGYADFIIPAGLKILSHQPAGGGTSRNWVFSQKYFPDLEL